jgi:hypothetical protein
MTLVLRSICALILLCIAVPLHAQDQSESLIAHGVALRKQGKNAEALLEFQRALQQRPSSRALAQVALAQQALGQWPLAEAGLVSALGARDDPWIRRNAAALDAALDTVRDRLGSLRVEANVAGAALFVNGQAVGTTPMAAAVRVAAGPVELEARADGYAPVHQTVQVASRSEQSVRLELAPLASRALTAPEPQSTAAAPTRVATPARVTAPAPVPAPARTAAPAGVARNDGRSASSELGHVDHGAPGSGLRTAAIVTFAVSSLFLAGGITAHVVSEYHRLQANDPSLCDELHDCSGYRRAFRTARSLAYVGYAAAGVTLITGVVLLIAAPSNTAPAARQWRASAGPDSVYLEFQSAL